jgi:hypothetical protein
MKNKANKPACGADPIALAASAPHDADTPRLPEKKEPRGVSPEAQKDVYGKT